jgi:hypothetical protein
MKSKKYTIAITLLVSLIWLSDWAEAEVVYDTIGGPTNTFGGAIGLATGSQGGSIITLAGTSRLVTHLDVAIEELSTLTGNLDYKINLWSAVGVPGSLIWSSPMGHLSALTRTTVIVGVDVPGVQVPNKFGWTIESIFASQTPGVVGSHNIYVGTANAEWYYNPSFGWQKTDLPPGSADVGFRVIAVPEPKGCILLVFGLMGLKCAKRQCRRS